MHVVTLVSLLPHLSSYHVLTKVAVRCQLACLGQPEGSEIQQPVLLGVGGTKTVCTLEMPQYRSISASRAVQRAAEASLSAPSSNQPLLLATLDFTADHHLACLGQPCGMRVQQPAFCGGVGILAQRACTVPDSGQRVSWHSRER